MRNSSRITKRSEAQFDPQNWLKEGDGLLASSYKCREVWIKHKSEISERTKGGSLNYRRMADDWPLLTGLPRSSFLLLGYAAEMYLKAGLSKAYIGCSKRMFERDIRHKYGHNLKLISADIFFEDTDGDQKRLKSLEDMILFDARYPISIKDKGSYSNKVNEQTSRIWNDKNYAWATNLVERVKSHARLIDNDERNPAYRFSVNIDDDGYLSFRSGGNLSPRITYCLSSEQRNSGKISLSDIRNIFDRSRYFQLQNLWDSSWIFEDTVKKTYERQRPEGSNR